MRGSAVLVTIVLALTALVTACADDDTADSRPATTTSAPSEAAPASTAPVGTEGIADTEEASTTSTTSEPPADQVASLAGLPWADPADAHGDPVTAVEAFVAFFTDRSDPPFWPADVSIGEFAAGDSRSGEVEVTFGEEAFDIGLSRLTRPTVTVFVRQAGPDDTWWVVGAASDALVVDAPAPDAAIGVPFDLAFTNRVISMPNEVELHGPGPDTLLFRAVASGGGIFAADDFTYRIDPSSCEDSVGVETLEDGTVAEVPLSVSVCAGPGRAGGPGTLVVFHNSGFTTVPVVFAAG